MRVPSDAEITDHPSGHEQQDWEMENYDFRCDFCQEPSLDDEAGTKDGERSCVNCCDENSEHKGE